ncbi:MAG: class I SAM-dependent methyltransferase [Bacteroidota bacterium]
MILKLIHTLPFLRRLYVTRLGPKWVDGKISPFIEFLKSEDKILDIGSGGGLVTKTLRMKGFNTTPLDIADLSYSDDVKPVVYNGRDMPFEDNQFDLALLLTILHHTENPEAILKETCRVAKRIVIIEDIYDSSIQKYLTLATDRFVNWGFSPCPHTNKNDEGWRSLFQKLNLELNSVSYHNVFGLYKQAVYHLVK